MSLRRRLTLSLFTILILFAINVGTHFWGSYARSESMVAYRNSVEAARLSSELEQSLDDQRQLILVLETLRDNTDDQLEADELRQAEEDISSIQRMIRSLGKLTTAREISEVEIKSLKDGRKVVLRDVARVAERFEEGVEAAAAAAHAAPGADGRSTRSRDAFDELEHEARLADAGRADDLGEAARSLGRQRVEVWCVGVLELGASAGIGVAAEAVEEDDHDPRVGLGEQRRQVHVVSPGVGITSDAERVLPRLISRCAVSDRRA